MISSGGGFGLESLPGFNSFTLTGGKRIAAVNRSVPYPRLLYVIPAGIRIGVLVRGSIYDVEFDRAKGEDKGMER